MQLQRHTAKVRWKALGFIGLSVFALLIPTIVDLLGREFVLGPWFWYIGGGLGFIAGLYQLAQTFRQFHVEVNEGGISVVANSLRASLPWAAVGALTIERGEGKDAEQQLVLWPVPGTPMSAKPDKNRNGSGGYSILDL